MVATPFRAFIDDWSLESRDDAPDAGISRFLVVASGAQFRYELTLSADKPPVLEGDKGYSRKSEDGRASYYFSQPFYAVEGELILRGAPIKVFGRAWMDREWSSQPLSPDQKGWDWFSLHLSSGEKLMLFRLRSASGRDFIGGNWIGADGATRQLTPEDVSIEPLATTTLAAATLPTRWRVAVKSHALSDRDDAAQPRELDGDALCLLGRADPIHRDARRRGLSRNDGILSFRRSSSASSIYRRTRRNSVRALRRDRHRAR